MVEKTFIMKPMGIKIRWRVSKSLEGSAAKNFQTDALLLEITDIRNFVSSYHCISRISYVIAT